MNKDVYYGVYDWDTVFNSVVPESTDYISVHFCVGTLTSNLKIQFITKMVQLCRKHCLFYRCFSVGRPVYSLRDCQC